MWLRALCAVHAVCWVGDHSPQPSSTREFEFPVLKSTNNRSNNRPEPTNNNNVSECHKGAHTQQDQQSNRVQNNRYYHGGVHVFEQISSTDKQHSGTARCVCLTRTLAQGVQSNMRNTNSNTNAGPLNPVPNFRHTLNHANMQQCRACKHLPTLTVILPCWWPQEPHKLSCQPPCLHD